MIYYERTVFMDATVKRPFAMARSVTKLRLIHRVAGTGHNTRWNAELQQVQRILPAKGRRPENVYTDYIRTGYQECSELRVILVCNQPSRLVNPILLTHGEVAERLALPEYTQCPHCFGKETA